MDAEGQKNASVDFPSNCIFLAVHVIVKLELFVFQIILRKLSFSVQKSAVLILGYLDSSHTFILNGKILGLGIDQLP